MQHPLDRGPPETDRRACAEMLRAMSDLRPMARRWSPDRATAEDLLQDTAERALRTYRQFEPGSNATAWVRTIMYRLAIDETRRCQRQRAMMAQYRATHPTCVGPCGLDDDRGRAADPAAEVVRAAGALGPKLRTTFLLWAVDRLSYRQISDRLGIPLNTVATRLLRARRELQRRVGTEC